VASAGGGSRWQEGIGSEASCDPSSRVFQTPDRDSLPKEGSVAALRSKMLEMNGMGGGETEALRDDVLLTRTQTGAVTARTLTGGVTREDKGGEREGQKMSWKGETGGYRQQHLQPTQVTARPGSLSLLACTLPVHGGLCWR
jgi:hypothetical protein